MGTASRLFSCALLMLGARLASAAAVADPQKPGWWAKQVPSSGFVPADENPDFDKYMAISSPVRRGKDGKLVRDELAAKGWDKALRTFYMTLLVKPDNPIRVRVPDIPATLPAKPMPEKGGATGATLHTDCKVLDVIEGRLLEATGKIGMAVSMGAFGYIVGLPGSRLDLTAFHDKPLPLAGRKWRATSRDKAFLLITPTEILLENVAEEK